MDDIRLRGTREAFFGTLPVSMIESFMASKPSLQIDAVIELAALWYLRFYASWRCAIEREPSRVYACRFADLAGNEDAVIADIAAFAGRLVDGATVSRVLSELRENRTEANLNVGRAGRGREIMGDAQIARVASIARLVGSEELLGGL